MFHSRDRSSAAGVSSVRVSDRVRTSHTSGSRSVGSGEPWAPRARRARKPSGLPIRVHRVGDSRSGCPVGLQHLWAHGAGASSSSRRRGRPGRSIQPDGLVRQHLSRFSPGLPIIQRRVSVRRPPGLASRSSRLGRACWPRRESPPCGGSGRPYDRRIAGPAARSGWQSGPPR